MRRANAGSGVGVYADWKAYNKHCEYVKARFPNATLAVFLLAEGYPVNTYITDRGMAIVDQNIGLIRGEMPPNVNILSRKRKHTYTAWKSAYEEIVKYEQGRKDTPFMPNFTR